MSKSANAGELRTLVDFKRIERTHDDDGFPVEREVVVLSAMTKWVNVHGSESYVAMQLDLREPATVTMRYSPLINRRMLVYRQDDPDPYEILSIDNVEQRNVWLELKVQRMLAAR